MSLAGQEEVAAAAAITIELNIDTITIVDANADADAESNGIAADSNTEVEANSEAESNNDALIKETATLNAPSDNLADDESEADADSKYDDIDNGGEFDDFDGYEFIDGFEEENFDDLFEFQFVHGFDEGSKGKGGEVKKKRKPKHYHARHTWGMEEEYLDGIPNGFEDDMRMPKDHFLYLLDGIRDCLTVDERRSMMSTQGNHPISPEIILCIGIRYLGQPTTVADLARMYGMSKSSIKRVLKMFFNAIEFNTDLPELQIQLPDPANDERINDLALDWQNLSGAFPLFDGFLGALDGFMARTEMPFDVENPRDYFSGHYQFYGLNVQAMCDHDLLFLYACVAAPGKVNDIRAFHRCTPLLKWLEALPAEYFIGADNAYPLSQKILVPFSKADMAGEERHKVYNYYLSQLRVRIEMSFGRLTTKWRCLRNALRCSTPRNAQIIIVCMKLHNFCIRMLRRDDPNYDPSKDTIDKLDGGIESSGNGYFPTVSTDDDGYASDEEDEDNFTSSRFPSVSSDSSRREERVLAVCDRNIRNVRRRLN